MNIQEIVTRAGKLVADNSPLILTAIGVTGTVTTAYLTGKASFRAAELIDPKLRKSIDPSTGNPLTTRETVELVWKEYIPAFGSGVLTIACIVAANRIGSRRAAAMAAAYSLSEKAWTEYKEKVTEKIGENKQRALRDELAQERVDRDPVGSRQIIVSGIGDVLCYDSLSKRYFQSDMETLRKAENDINFQMLHDASASLGDFYLLIGIPTTAYSEEVGWSSDQLLELTFSTTLSEDNQPCIVIGYNVIPIRGYNRLL